MTPIWMDDEGRRVSTRSCHVPGCDREWPQYRHRFEHPSMIGWVRPRQVIRIVNWCGHAQVCVAWPEADGYWTLVPVLVAEHLKELAE